MQLRPQNERILFGLKLRQLRQLRELSFQQLSKLTGISVSYLNEIERGKKSPKKEKLRELATALDVEVTTLVDPELDAAMMPVADLLRSNFLNELPLDRFGIELSKIVEIIGNAPARVGAFISSLLELSRNYALMDENFYTGALRSWLEMHENFLEDSEVSAKKLREELTWAPSYVPSAEELGYLLRFKYDYRILKGGLEEHEAFIGLERVFLPTDRSLLLSGTMQERDLRYHLAKEIGYQILKLSNERSLTSPIVEVSGFDMALAQARAHAFASALLLPAEQFDAELKGFFGEGELAPDIFQQLLRKYEVTPMLLLDRVAALIPQFRDIRSLYLIQLTESEEEGLQVTRELHLGAHHRPHSTGLLEHYCRRWVGVRLLLNRRESVQVGLQVSQFHGFDEEYLVLAISDREHNGKRQSTFLGMPLTPELEGTIPALVKADLKHKVVSNTCERCSIVDCTERAASPDVADLRQKRKNVGETIKELQRKSRLAARRRL